MERKQIEKGKEMENFAQLFGLLGERGHKCDRSMEFPRLEPSWPASVCETGGLDDSVMGRHSKDIKVRLR